MESRDDGRCGEGLWDGEGIVEFWVSMLVAVWIGWNYRPEGLGLEWSSACGLCWMVWISSVVGDAGSKLGEDIEGYCVLVVLLMAWRTGWGFDKG